MAQTIGMQGGIMKEIIVKVTELPCLVRVLGKNGAAKLYQLLPSKKKLGVLLNVVTRDIATELNKNLKS
jgi:hypothetical protein